MSGFYGLDCSLGYCSTDCNAPVGGCNYTAAECVCANTPVGFYSGSQCLSFTTSAAATLRSTHTRSWLTLALQLLTLALAGLPLF